VLLWTAPHVASFQLSLSILLYPCLLLAFISDSARQCHWGFPSRFLGEVDAETKRKPPAGITTPKQRRLDEPFARRENEVYLLEGDLWRVKLEDNDCDFHLELSAPGAAKTASRIIVEIP
jgi:hypothetical protein